ncbi:hypothetical protein [Staphylococcus sp. LKG3-3]|uniref:hypothetical protein n=1 Tax=Staphylococcus sp. LKG3-3 TaxID=3399685 RepID=UPI003D3F2954
MITPLYNERHEHVADVTTESSKIHHIKGVPYTSLGHVDRKVGFVELQEFKKSFGLITESQFQDEQTSIFEYLEE